MAIANWAYLAGLGMTVAGGRRASKANEKTARQNQQIADMAAIDAMERGAEEERQLRRDYAQLLGKQQAYLAAQGFNLGEDTALNLQLDTVRQGEIDALTLRNNTVREAWGLKVQAYDYANQASMLKSSRNFGTFSTVLTGAADYAFKTGMFENARPTIRRG